MFPRPIVTNTARIAGIFYGLCAFLASSVLAMDQGSHQPFQISSSDQVRKGDRFGRTHDAPAEASWRNAFGMMAVRTNRISGFERWQDMLSRASLGCGKICPPRWQDWMQTTQDVGGISQFAQLKIINWFVNQTLTYRRDVVAFGVADYWASPVESLRRGGDCEDFVALKYLALRQAGFPEEHLRIVILQDLQRGQPHAVLVAQLDGINYVLDNQLDDLAADTELDRYRPVYSFNSKAKWVHLQVRNREKVAMAN